MSAFDPKRTLPTASQCLFRSTAADWYYPLSSACGAAMRRRDFIGVIGSAITWPVTARAQPPLPVVGFLSSRSPTESELDLAGFRQGLSQSGYVEHQNVAIEYRWAENQYDRLPALAAELVKRQVRVIAAVGGPTTALAVKAATKTIPFVFTTGVDPVKLGLVDSFAKPGGNATGVNMFITAVEAKRLGLLHELVPSASPIAVIINPNSPEIDRQLSDCRPPLRLSNVSYRFLGLALRPSLKLFLRPLLKIQCELTCQQVTHSLTATVHAS